MWCRLVLTTVKFACHLQVQQSSSILRLEDDSCTPPIEYNHAGDPVPLHQFKFSMDRPGGTIILKLSSPKGVELAQAVLDVKVLRDGNFAMWALADDGGVQSARWTPGTAAWEVRYSSAHVRWWYLAGTECSGHESG
jgi:hypothetical protein